MRRLTFALAALLVALPLQAADVPAHLAAAVAAPERSDKDRERDVRERPAELMAWAGVQPGMKVADVFGGGGYWSELLSRAVGPGGAVTLVNNAPYWNFGKDDIKARFADNRLPGVTRRVVETCDLKLGKEQYDLILMFMAYHDIYWVNENGGWPAIDTDGFVRQLYAALKQGGLLLIVDNAAAAGAGSSSVNQLHRIEESFAKRDFETHGFELEATWDGYRNPGDDYTKLVFDPAVRGKTDRFVHLYEKE
jgi:predicted methyltransferase